MSVGLDGRMEGGSTPPLAENIPVLKNGAADTASRGDLNCVKVLYDNCSAVGITDLLVKRAQQEPPGVRLAMVNIWRAVLANLGAKPQLLEHLWIEADLNPNVNVTPEDRARAEAAAEEALAPCRICVVDLPTFLRLVRRVTLAAKPSGDLLLVVEIEYGGDEISIVTKPAAWIRKTREGVEYTTPLVFRENLRKLGLMVDANARDLYLELFRRAERYDTVEDAYVKPILLQAVERLRAFPHLAKCSRDNKVIYIAVEVFREALWFFDSRVALGRNKLYAAFRRRKLLASPTTVSVALSDEYGGQVKKRALAFHADRLAEFIDYDVKAICQAAAGLTDETAEEDSGYV